LLLFGLGKCGPDGGAIGVAPLADIGKYILDVEGGLSIGFGNGGADQFKTVEVGGGVELYGRSGLLFGV
jgi:hypothetical protein